MPILANLGRLERQTRSLLGCFSGLHQRKVKILVARFIYGRYVSLPPWWRELNMPCGFQAPLGSTLRYLGSWLMDDAGSPLWLLVVTEWTVSVAVYPVWEVYDTCRLWYCPPRELLTLQIFPLLGVMGTVGYQDFQLYLARI